MTRDTLEGDLEVLGIENAKWIDGELCYLFFYICRDPIGIKLVND
ncbi:hypothetical protein [Peribacillus simplex]